MALEIERKFLVKGNQWKKHVKQKQELKQGYLSTNLDEWVVRIRIVDNKKSFLTVKKSIRELTNHEFEWDIPFKEAQSIWNLINHKLIKKRYTVIINGSNWAIDCFEDENSPLIIAEIELDSTESIIEKPSWCSFEISNIKEFSNASLAKSPFGKWSEEKLISFNLG